MGIEASVTAAIGDVAASDQAAVELAVSYARAIDEGAELHKIGPLLLSALEALLLTPRARAAALKKGTDDKPAANPLDELRERRARRDGAPAVDTTAS
ncbi:terminase small subunit [Pseudonocardia abyssalis]|uniref:Terminase small subunit actinomycetes phage-type domain-containing protein n=1 Tax=Pseudonocardia abyssalis TaxID=2792008 RepID=A0ABS6UX46_9PSEU|nr:hypothetical protein [Pseudonocardia abyssalis]MBW0136852.1 hypothetical protein [Pseudonocardia abyssalis]